MRLSELDDPPINEGMRTLDMHDQQPYLNNQNQPHNQQSSHNYNTDNASQHLYDLQETDPIYDFYPQQGEPPGHHPDGQMRGISPG